MAYQAIASVPGTQGQLADGLVASLLERTIVDGRTALKRQKLDQESVAQRLLAIYEEVLR